MNKEEIKYYVNSYDEILDVTRHLEVIAPEIVVPRNQRSYKITCPIHEETEPSFSYSESLGIWTCFGACHTSGKVVKLHYMWLKKLYGEHVTIYSALKDLKELYPTILPDLVEEDSVRVERKLDILESMKSNIRDNKKSKLIYRTLDLDSFVMKEFTRDVIRNDIK